MIRPASVSTLYSGSGNSGSKNFGPPGYEVTALDFASLTRIGAWLLVGLLMLTTGCAEPVAQEPPLRPVRYQTVTVDGAEVRRTYAGVARSGIETQLSFRVNGTVESLPVDVGQRVRRGQLLARVDPTDYELQVQQSEAALAQAEAGRRRAEADYERVRGLYENNNAAKSELDAGRANAESARAQVAAAEKQLELTRKQVGYTTLRAPLDGAVAAVFVEANENVQAGQGILLLTASGELKVEAAVPEVTIADIAPGMAAEVSFDALPGQSFRGRVTEVGVAAIGSATTFPLTVELESQTGAEAAEGALLAIRSGMAAEVSLTLAPPGTLENSRVIHVPPVSVGEDAAGRFVFLLQPRSDGTGTVERRGVTVGELSQLGLEIKQGLSVGDLLVTAGVRRLSDGLEVKVLESGA